MKFLRNYADRHNLFLCFSDKIEKDKIQKRPANKVGRLLATVKCY